MKKNNQDTITKDQVTEAKLETADNPDAILKKTAEILDDYDGLEFFSELIEETANLFPSRPAKRDKFFASTDNIVQRKALKRKLNLWLEMVTKNESVSEMVEQAQSKSKSASENYNLNIKAALDASRDLETSYRTVGAFFVNAGETADKVLFINAPMDDLQNLDRSHAYNALKAKFEETFNNFDLENTIGALVIPGYLGRKAIVNKYGRMANEYKALLITDYYNADNFKDLKKDFKDDKLAGSDEYLSNVMMCAVYVQGRQTNKDLGEEPMYLPPSAFLAGRVYAAHESDTTHIAQPIAGEKFGELFEAEEVKFRLLKSQTGELEEQGLIPLNKIRGKVVPMSARTLFNGKNEDIQQYSIVRIYDWVTKILIDYLNRKTFELFTPANRKDIYSSIVSFLDDLVRAGIIKGYSKPKIQQDPKKESIVHVSVGITPLYATRAFHISLRGESDNKGGGKVGESED